MGFLTHCSSFAARTLPLEDLAQITAQLPQITGNASGLSHLCGRSIPFSFNNCNFDRAAPALATPPLHQGTPRRPLGRKLLTRTSRLLP
jgi:hypothetical protein